MLDRLYICPCCFKYSKELVSWWKHVHYCEKKAFIPGIKVYTHPRRSKMVNVPQVNPKSTSQVGTTKGKGKDKSDDGRHVTDETVNEGEWSVWEVDGEKEGVSYFPFPPSLTPEANLQISCSARISPCSRSSS
jgi:hypothetical protein